MKETPRTDEVYARFQRGGPVNIREEMEKLEAELSAVRGELAAEEAHHNHMAALLTEARAQIETLKKERDAGQYSTQYLKWKMKANELEAENDGLKKQLDAAMSETDRFLASLGIPTPEESFAKIEKYRKEHGGQLPEQNPACVPVVCEWVNEGAYYRSVCKWGFIAFILPTHCPKCHLPVRVKGGGE